MGMGLDGPYADDDIRFRFCLTDDLPMIADTGPSLEPCLPVMPRRRDFRQAKSKRGDCFPAQEVAIA
jgi:hypothetical protein